MLRHILLVATMATTGTAGALAATSGTAHADTTIATARELASRPPAPWQADDPADSLYRAGREQLNRGDYRRAAGTFERIVGRYPRSTYAGDALYWQAYSLYRVGEPGELRTASRVLDRQRSEYPRAATRGNADALSVRVKEAWAMALKYRTLKKMTDRDL